MRQFHPDHVSPEDRDMARRIYAALAGFYGSLLLGVFVTLLYSSPQKAPLELASTDAQQASGIFSAMAAERPTRRECAVRDLKLVTALGERGEAQDVSADDLRAAFFTVVKARNACADGRIDEALALYDSVVVTPQHAAKK